MGSKLSTPQQQPGHLDHRQLQHGQNSLLASGAVDETGSEAFSQVCRLQGHISSEDVADCLKYCLVRDAEDHLAVVNKAALHEEGMAIQGLELLGAVGKNGVRLYRMLPFDSNMLHAVGRPEDIQSELEGLLRDLNLSMDCIVAGRERHSLAVLLPAYLELTALINRQEAGDSNQFVVEEAYRLVRAQLEYKLRCVRKAIDKMQGPIFDLHMPSFIQSVAGIPRVPGPLFSKHKLRFVTSQEYIDEYKLGKEHKNLVLEVMVEVYLIYPEGADSNDPHWLLHRSFKSPDGQGALLVDGPPGGFLRNDEYLPTLRDEDLQHCDRSVLLLVATGETDRKKLTVLKRMMETQLWVTRMPLVINRGSVRAKMDGEFGAIRGVGIIAPAPLVEKVVGVLPEPLNTYLFKDERTGQVKKAGLAYSSCCQLQRGPPDQRGVAHPFVVMLTRWGKKQQPAGELVDMQPGGFERIARVGEYKYRCLQSQVANARAWEAAQQKNTQQQRGQQQQQQSKGRTRRG